LVRRIAAITTSGTVVLFSAGCIGHLNRRLYSENLAASIQIDNAD
jgi:hypothetical protein